MCFFVIFISGQLLVQIAALLSCHHCLFECAILFVLGLTNKMMMMMMMMMMVIIFCINSTT